MTNSKVLSVPFGVSFFNNYAIIKMRCKWSQEIKREMIRKYPQLTIESTIGDMVAIEGCIDSDTYRHELKWDIKDACLRSKIQFLRKERDYIAMEKEWSKPGLRIIGKIDLDKPKWQKEEEKLDYKLEEEMNNADLDYGERQAIRNAMRDHDEQYPSYM